MSRKLRSIFPLSPQQQGMLFETIYSSGPERSALHVQQLAWTMDGALDVEIFETAWQRVIDRHGVLRTAFVWKDQDAPLQVEVGSVPAPFAVHDWRDLESGEQERLWEEHLQSDLRDPLDLSKPPLLRLALFRLGDGEHRFLWTFHHILLDGWGWPIVLRELFTIYLALRRGDEPELPPVPSYREYVAWLGERDLGEAMRFWRENLAGIDRPTPLGEERESVGSPDGARHRTSEGSLPAETTGLLRTLLRRRRLTFNTLVQALWGVLLSAYSDRDDVLFGITVSGRPGDLEGVESIVGLFINTLPMRLEVPEDRPFDQWLAEVQRRQLEVRGYEHCSEGQVHQWSDVPASRPLYDSILVFENFPTELSVLRDADLAVSIRQAQFRGAYTKHALSILATEGERLGLRLTWDTERFAGADRVLAHWRALAAAVAENPGATVGALRRSIAGAERPLFRPQGRGAAPRLAGDDRPRTRTEEDLAALWARVVGVERVGIHDDFFELGGHSLLAMEILRRVRERFRIELPLRHLFEAPTVAELSVVIAQKQAEQLGEKDGVSVEDMLERLESMSDDEARREAAIATEEVSRG
ncbi:MAG: condensation domain-containing protein [Acidobacteriota bacterium]|jgi:acyl carrier protein